MAEALKPEDYVRRAYEIIGAATPIKADCGRLCGAACCKDYQGDGTELEVGTSAENGKDTSEDAALATSEAADSPACADAAIAAPDAAPACTPPSPLQGRGWPNGPGVAAPACTPPSPLHGRGWPNGPGVAAPGDGNTAAPAAAPDCSDQETVPDKLGMVLFPGEINILSQEPGYRFFRIPFMGGRAWFMVCEGTCDRRKRPLACRIFPLAPHIGESGAVHAEADPRARRVCPLADCENLDPAFRRAVAKALRYLAREPEILEYMRLLSADLEDMRLFMKLVSFTDMQ